MHKNYNGLTLTLKIQRPAVIMHLWWSTMLLTAKTDKKLSYRRETARRLM